MVDAWARIPQRQFFIPGDNFRGGVDTSTGQAQQMSYGVSSDGLVSGYKPFLHTVNHEQVYAWEYVPADVSPSERFYVQPLVYVDPAYQFNGVDNFHVWVGIANYGWHEGENDLHWQDQSWVEGSQIVHNLDENSKGNFAGERDLQSGDTLSDPNWPDYQNWDYGMPFLFTVKIVGSGLANGDIVFAGLRVVYTSL